MQQQFTRIVAIRHGETAWNVDTRIQGHVDIPLNANGREQARRLAGAVAHDHLGAVYTSDLARAHETAAAIAAPLGLPVHGDAGLRERAFGVFEGLTFREIEQRWPEQAQRWRRRDPEFGPEGGERLADFYARCTAAAVAIAARHPGETIALVAHGGVMDCLYRAASRIALDAPRTWQLGNATVNRLLHGASGFTLVGWDDDQHLRDHADGDAGARSLDDVVVARA